MVDDEVSPKQEQVLRGLAAWIRQELGAGRAQEEIVARLMESGQPEHEAREQVSLEAESRGGATEHEGTDPERRVDTGAGEQVGVGEDADAEAERVSTPAASHSAWGDLAAVLGGVFGFFSNGLNWLYTGLLTFSLLALLGFGIWDPLGRTDEIEELRRFSSDIEARVLSSAPVSAGDCMLWPESSGQAVGPGTPREQIRSVDCSEPGSLAVEGTFQVERSRPLTPALRHAGYPTSQYFLDAARDRCPSSATHFFHPTEIEWERDGARWVVCAST